MFQHLDSSNNYHLHLFSSGTIHHIVDFIHVTILLSRKTLPLDLQTSRMRIEISPMLILATTAAGDLIADPYLVNEFSIKLAPTPDRTCAL